MTFSDSSEKGITTSPRVYALDCSRFTDPDVFARALSLLPEERRRRARRFRMPRDRALSAGAGLLLRRALRDCGYDPDEIRIEYDALGKPRAVNAPGFFFSISHSGDYAVLSCAPFENGCDIEKKGRESRGIAKRFFLPSEYEYVCSGATPEERNDRFFRLWTVKESFLKLTGQGLKMELSSFEIVPRDGGFELKQDYDPRTCFVRELDAPDGYCCSLCAYEDVRDVEYVLTDSEKICE